MEYRALTENNLSDVVNGYIAYYNECEDSCWTYEKARKRIHQVMTTEDSECVAAYDNGGIIGFYMGYYKEYDDLKAYYLDEIVIFAGHQNKGYGTALMREMEARITKNGARHIDLISVNDEHHAHFYKKLGFYGANNLTVMGKHFD